MKKLLAITVLLCFAGVSQLFAVNPIPSYNVLVTGKAIFQESSGVWNTGNLTDAKRKMNIQTSTASPSGKAANIIAVKVFRLDGTIVLGPYYIVCGQSLQVQIDFKKWGVEVVTQATSRVSVWTSTEE